MDDGDVDDSSMRLLHSGIRIPPCIGDFGLVENAEILSVELSVCKRRDKA